MKNKLIQLRQNLGLIETKGESTKIMANCLAFTEQLIQECEEAETKADTPVEARNED